MMTSTGEISLIRHKRNIDTILITNSIFKRRNIDFPFYFNKSFFVVFFALSTLTEFDFSVFITFDHIFVLFATIILKENLSSACHWHWF